jgi:hypothetical protein
VLRAACCTCTILHTGYCISHIAYPISHYFITGRIPHTRPSPRAEVGEGAGPAPCGPGPPCGDCGACWGLALVGLRLLHVSLAVD